jgi:hypothetical protein
MNRNLRARLARLEEAHRVDPVVLHFADTNEPPLTISGTAKNFFRLIAALGDNDHPPQLLRDTLFQLDGLRNAVRIEGRSAQLFSLAQALAIGPAPDNPQV